MTDAVDIEAAIRDPLADLLGFQLRRAAAAVSLRLTRELEPLGLAPGDAGLLLQIAANPGITQSDIARTTRAQTANLVPLIGKLERIGAVERRSGRGRALSLMLTPAGEALYRQVAAVVASVEERLRAALGDDRRAGALELMDDLTRAACRTPEERRAAA